jgi:hypothetical protein
MPGEMSGYTLAKRIAAEKPELRRLITSGFSEALMRGDSQASEFKVLRKPYRQADLAKAFHALLD